MRNRLLAALSPLFLALTPNAGAAQTALQLRWELTPDSQATFTLTNRDTKPLPPSGWAIYFSALHSADSGSVGAGFAIQEVLGDLHRIVPGAGFAGLAPGATVMIPYVTQPLRNRSFVPSGPYIVFDSAKDVGVPLSDYVAAAFERSHDVVTPEAQFALDSAINDIPASELPPVFPTPLEVTQGTGALRLTALPQITAGADLVNEATFAAEYLRPYFRAGGKATVPPLRLELGPVEGQPSPEAYELVIDPAAGVRIVGVSSAGVFYGLQSLRDLLSPPAPSPRGELVVPAIRVVDAPRFGYRGFMLDVARNFQAKPAVLRTLDLLARYKLNVFHMHLTDDEGWRVEIAGLPELTAVGARRGHTLDSKRFLQPAFGSGPRVAQPWGSGFFSHADYVEIVRYAAERHIEVIPEIEMPGHARAAIKAMDARADREYSLSDPEDRSVYTSVQGYPDNVINPALESTYRFIERVVGDLAAMHREAGAPLRHIHMGGDEVPGGVWVGSPAVQAYMQAHGLTSVDDLWFVFYRNAGADSVFVGKDRLTDYGRAHIVGIQGNLWSETLGGDGRLDYMMVPKLFGLAERAWAPQPDWARERDPARSASLYREAWARFVNVIGQRELPRLDREVPGLGYRIPTPGLKVEGGMVRSSVELPGFTLRYTTDGSEPTVRSAVVRGPIPLRGTVRVAAFSTTGRKGHTALLTAR